MHFKAYQSALAEAEMIQQMEAGVTGCGSQLYKTYDFKVLIAPAAGKCFLLY